MAKEVVDIRACKKGNIVAEDVFDKRGSLVVPKNVLISDYIVDRLDNLGIHTITIYVNDGANEPSTILERQIEDFGGEYDRNLSVMENTINNLSKGEKLEFKPIKDITISVFKETIDKNGSIRYVNRLKEHDEYIYQHSLNVAIYSSLAGKWLGLENDKLKEVVMSALLHDIGKVQIPNSILNKKENLTDNEMKMLKKHTIIGYEMIKDNEHISEDVKLGVLHSHEKEDGSGYPYGIKKDEIGLYGKIIAVANFYDLITSKQVNRLKATPFEAVKIFENTGLEIYDLNVGFTFLKNIVNCYIGEKIVTNKGDLGEIIYVPPHRLSTPIIRIGKDLIDLSKEQSTKIVRMA